jgi:RNA polymerase sigma-70 factor, ECF subfamily
VFCIPTLEAQTTPRYVSLRVSLQGVADVDETLCDAGLPPDSVIVAGLRAGDEAMFATLLDAWSPGMLRVARGYVADAHTAEDVVQDSWLGVLRGIGAFRARSSLRTWIYRILINTAKTRGVRDARTIPVNNLAPTAEDSFPNVDPARLYGPTDAHPGHWQELAPSWLSPEVVAVARETREHLARALALLPARQRVVITLRDVQGYTTEEVCTILDVTPANQRVLLYRARAAVRASLEQYLKTSSEIDTAA